MHFKSILTVVTDRGLADQAVAVAAAIAVQQDGHLDVLALGADEMQPGYSYIGAGAPMMDWSVQQAEQDANAAAKAARSTLNGQPANLRWSLETAVTVMGRASAVIGDKATFADLVVQPAPQDKPGRILAETVIEAALFQGNAPVLIVPPGVDLARVAAPRRIILAWNQSNEALNAAKRALPLLKAAEIVDVTVVDPPATGAERSDPGGPLCQFLARHGVRVKVTVLARSMPKVSDALAALDCDADLLVMGAYGHSRLREAVLGGATRDILQSTRLPVLMAH